MKRYLTLLILMIKLLIVLLPILSSSAPPPQTFTATDVGTWIGQIIQYWSDVLDSIRKEVINDEALAPGAAHPRGDRLRAAGPGHDGPV